MEKHTEVQMEKKHDLLNLFIKFGEGTTMHGMGRAVGSQQLWKRLVWSLLVIGGAGWGTYQLISIVQEYYTFPVSTTVSLAYSPSLTFPAVTVCNLNRIRDSKTPKSLRDISDSFQNDSSVILQDKLNEFSRVLRQYDWQQYSHTMSDMLLRCRFDTFHCTDQHFSDSYSSLNVGNCYTFGDIATREREATRAGPERGFVLELNINQDDYHFLTPAAGVKVLLHPSNEVAFPEDEGYVAAPGFSTSIGVKLVKTRRLPSPYGDCVTSGLNQDNVLLNMFEQEGYTYTSLTCRKTCYQVAAYRYCECCDDSYPCESKIIKAVVNDGRVGDIEFCNTSDTYVSACLSQLAIQYRDGDLGCDDICSPSCNQTTYQTTISTSLWPADSYLDTYIKEINRTGKLVHGDLNDEEWKAYIKANALRLEIYYETLTYQYIEAEPAYDWQKLLGDIGGQMGLWLGVSLLTIIELVELLLDAVVVLVKKMCRVKPTSSPVAPISHQSTWGLNGT